MERRIKHIIRLTLSLSLIVLFSLYSAAPVLASRSSAHDKLAESHGKTPQTLAPPAKQVAIQHLSDDSHPLRIVRIQLLTADGKFLQKELSPKELAAFKTAVGKAVEKGCFSQDPEAFTWGSCVKGCLADVGVTAYSLILCGVSCATGVVWICAVCLGVSVAVLEACALGCALYPN